MAFYDLEPFEGDIRDNKTRDTDLIVNMADRREYDNHIILSVTLLKSGEKHVEQWDTGDYIW